MRTYVDAMLRQYGQELTLRHWESGEETALKAFVQPHLKKQLHPPVSVTPLGTVSTQRWTYIGPGDTVIRPGDSLRTGTMVWSVQETHPVVCGNEILYRWALLQFEKEIAQ